MRKATTFIVLVLAAAAIAACARYNQMKDELSERFAKLRAGNAAGGDADWVHEDTDGGAGLVEATAAACTIHTHHDEYYGFTVGHPEGWRVDYSTGAIVVAKDAYGYTGALVFPARLKRKDLPAERIATVFASGLGKKITQRGGTFQMSDKHTNGKVARATIHATVGGVALQGPLEVVEAPGFVTLKLYWAPEDTFEAEEATLKQVTGCFKRDTMVTAKKPVAPPGGPVTKVGAASDPLGGANAAPAQALTPHAGKYMHMSLAAGWRVTDEGDHGIDVVAPDGKAGAGFGYVLNPGRISAAAALRQDLAKLWPGVHIVQAGFVPAPAGWQVYAAEFDGQTRGAPIHGFERVAVSRGIMITTGFQTAPDQWDKLRSTCVAMLASAQIQPAAIAQVQAEVRAQLASYPPVRSSYTPSSGGSSSSGSTPAMGDALDDDGLTPQERQARGFDDFIRGQDRATSPSTGEEYTCPYNLWQANGPQGAGYYRSLPGGGSELLNLQEQ